jgi:glycosyltransferase involved in cell wall biosynthesis
MLIVYPTSADYLAEKGIVRKVEFKWKFIAEAFDKCIIAMPASSTTLRVDKAKFFCLPRNKFFRALSLPIWLTYLMVVFCPSIIRVYDFVWASLVLPLAKLMGIPIVMSLHGHWESGLADIERNPFRRWAYRILEKIAIRGSTVVICTSRSLCHHAQEIGAQRVEHIPTWGVDLDSVGFRPRHRPNEDGFWQILMIGRIARQKNIELAIHILKILREERGINAKLIIVGPYDDLVYISELKALVVALGIGDHVQFTGGLPNDRVMRMYLEADCLLMTSVMEGTPHPVLESLASNCPIVSSAVGDVRELIEDGKNGYVFDLSCVEPVRVAALIEAAFKMGTLPDHYGRNRVFDIYSTQASATKERDVLRAYL